MFASAMLLRNLARSTGAIARQQLPGRALSQRGTRAIATRTLPMRGARIEVFSS